MEISYDPAKRAATLAARGLDFRDSATVFAGPRFTIVDDRRDYGEVRFQSFGLLDDRLVMVVWTLRGEGRHVISMRKCNERERQKFEERLGRSR